jgi:hypothetical protein
MAENEPRDEIAARDEARATETLRGQLLQRGVRLFGNEAPDELGDIADEVDRFEAARAALGADSMRNAPDSALPEDPRLVLPARRDDESVARYTARINAAAELLRRARGASGHDR